MNTFPISPDCFPCRRWGLWTRLASNYNCLYCAHTHWAHILWLDVIDKVDRDKRCTCTACGNTIHGESSVVHMSFLVTFTNSMWYELRSGLTSESCKVVTKLTYLKTPPPLVPLVSLFVSFFGTGAFYFTDPTLGATASILSETVAFRLRHNMFSNMIDIHNRPSMWKWSDLRTWNSQPLFQYYDVSNMYSVFVWGCVKCGMNLPHFLYPNTHIIIMIWSSN